VLSLKSCNITSTLTFFVKCSDFWIKIPGFTENALATKLATKFILWPDALRQQTPLDGTGDWALQELITRPSTATDHLLILWPSFANSSMGNFKN
jgi:hypothetical protein